MSPAGIFRCWKADPIQVELVYSQLDGEKSGRLESGLFISEATGQSERIQMPPWQGPEETMLERFRRWL